MLLTRLTLDDLPERYAFLDPAGKRQGGKSKVLDACRPSISVVAVDSLERFFWLYQWAKKCSTRELINQIFLVQDRFQPVVFGCEANAMQSLFADAVDVIAELEGRRPRLTAISVPTQIDKVFRIRVILQSVVNEGRLLVSEQIAAEDLAEVTGFPLHPKRDVIDSLASAVNLAPPRRRDAVGVSRRLAHAYERESAQLYTDEPGTEPVLEGDDPFAEFKGLRP